MNGNPLLALLAAMLALAACVTVEPIDYTPVGEIKPGPGLFSGDDGKWVLEKKL